MVGSRWLVVAMGVFSLGLGLACGDDRRMGANLDEGPSPPGGPAGPAGDPSAASFPTRFPPIGRFAPGTFCEGDQWCWYNPTPVGNGWLAAGTAGAQDIWIAGTGNGLHWDGRGWSVFQSPLLRTTGIWAASQTDIWMVGSLPPAGPGLGPRSGIAHGDGQTFEIVYQDDNSSFFQSVWGSGPNDVWAVGLSGNTAHFDGQSWTREPVFAGPFVVSGSTVDGSGPDDVWVGDSTALYHFDGTVWTEVPEIGFQIIFDVAARARDDVWVSAVSGGINTIYHYDGTTWTQTFSRSSIGDGLLFLSIDARTASDVWAAGSRPDDGAPNGFTAVLMHWDGTSWTPAEENHIGVNDILSLPNGHLAVGNAGHVFELSTTGQALAVRDLNPSPTPRLFGVWGSSPSEMWAVGSTGTALHYDGRAVLEEATGVSSRLLDVWGTGPDDIWAVGDGGVVLRRSAPGGYAVWTALASGTSAPLNAVFTAAPDDVWIGGDAGLFHSDGAVITPVALPGLSATGVVNDIHGLAPNDIWAAGEDLNRAFVSHYDGTQWSPIQIVDQSGVGVARIWMVASNDVWGDVTIEARDHGPENTWHFDGTTWTPRFLAPPADRWMFPVPGLDNGLFGLGALDAFSFSRDDVWAAGSLGAIVRRAP